MSDRERQTLENLADNLKKMDPEDKGFLLGYATAKAEEAEQQEERK